MRSSIMYLVSFAALAVAIPMTERQVVEVCSSGTAQCCDVNVLGIADLDCETPPVAPTSLTDFNDVCATVGKIDMCCLLPILDQGLICSSPTGT